jgi:hypothetical protein
MKSCTPKYDEIYKFGSYGEHFALVRIGNLFGLVDDETGYELVPCKYDEIGIPGSHGDNAFLVRKNGKYGITGMEGYAMIECIYDKIEFSETSGYTCRKGIETFYFDLNGLPYTPE